MRFEVAVAKQRSGVTVHLIRIGGPCNYFVQVSDRTQLLYAISGSWLRNEDIVDRIAGMNCCGDVLGSLILILRIGSSKVPEGNEIG
ncbi:hypothetical protein C5167_029917 [Papaver somniferum]|nr:hypothetical protein C5167_029917 [Papaver somniferum]